MSQILTEGTNLAFVTEAVLGAAVPPTTGWINGEPNSYGSYGPTYKKVARMPISKNRQLQKGMLVDEDSAMPFESDITKDVIDNFMAGFMMSLVKHSGGTGQSLFAPTGVTATGYTVAALGNVATGTLVFARNFTNASNNGLKSTTASIATEIKAAGLVVEAAPPAAARAEVAGYRATVAADIQMNASGNLTATTANFTTMGLNVGQWIWVGGTIGGANAFAIQPTYRGFARIVTIAAGVLTLERRSWTVAGADVATGKSIDLYFSRWARNVAIDHADYVTPSYAFEVTYPNLGGAGVPEYEYMLGCMIDEWTWNFPLTDKATVSIGMKGTTSLDPTTARLTGPSTATSSTTHVGVATSTDLMRLRISNIDETGVETDFKSIKVTFKNNVDPEKQLGTLGAALMNVGKFEVHVDTEVIFTNEQIIKAIHDNRTCSMDIGFRNTDFGGLIDVSAMTVDAGDRKLATNKSVTVSAKTTGFQDQNLGYTASLSLFAFLPAS